MSLSVPVAFFLFNRPDYTRRVFEVIAVARPKTLLLIADGPRFPEEEILCQQARAVLNQVDWDCTVYTKFSDQNMGCKRRVSSGLDWVFQQCEEAIILEDDCLPHPDLFGFCAQMLDKYRDDERIMMVGGMNYLLDKLDVQESYLFSRYFPIWGWATWRRAWEKYDATMRDWSRLKKQKQLHSIYGRKGFSRYLTLLFDSALETDTWDISWVYSCVFQNGLCVVPKVNLISNIGVDGTHSRGKDHYHHLPMFALPAQDLIHPRLVFPNAVYDDMLVRQVLQTIRLPLRRRLAAKLPMGLRKRLVRLLSHLRMGQPHKRFF